MAMLTEFSTRWITPSELDAQVEAVPLSRGTAIPLGRRDASLLLEAALMMQAGSPITPLRNVKAGLMDASLISDASAQGGKVLKLGYVAEPYLTYMQMHVSPQTGDAVLVIETAKALGDDLLIPMAELDNGTMIFAVIRNYLVKRPNEARLSFLVAAPQEEESRSVAQILHLALNHMSNILSSLMVLFKPTPALLSMAPGAGKTHAVESGYVH